MAKKKSRKRGWSGAPAARPSGGTRPAGSTAPVASPRAGATTATDDAPTEPSASPRLTKPAPAAPRPEPAAASPSQAASNRAARKEEARRQRELIRKREARRRAMRRYGTIAAIVVAAGVLVTLLVVANGSKGTKNPDPASLPGIDTGAAPWPAETANLQARIDKMGMPPLGAEALAYHIHQNLQVYIDGSLEPVPTGVGAISSSSLAEIHTHDASGTIHVEAGAVRDYSLQDVFDVWGVLFTKDQIGEYKADAQNKIRIYVDGKLFGSDPTKIPLKDQEVIVVTYGTASELPSPIPSVFHYGAAPTAPGAGSGTPPATSAPATSAPATSAPAPSAS